MKAKHCLIPLTFALASSLQAADVLVDTQFESWSLERNSSISGDQLAQSIADTASTIVQVPQYSGPFQLSRVVIRFVQPDSASPDLSATVSTVGTDSEFTNLTVGIQTNIAATAALYASIETITAGPVTVAGTSDDLVNAADPVNYTLTPSTPFNANLSYVSSEVMFDSNFIVLSGNLNDVFAGGGTLDFDLDSLLGVTYERDNNINDITLNTTGADTGQVIIEYYSIPEPSSVALFGLVGLGFVIRRRR